MARKKTIVTTEEVETPEETPIDYKKDLENKSFDQVAQDAPKEEVKEEPKVEPKVEEETETIEFDPEAFKKEVAEQTRKEMLEALQGKDKEETTENVDAYQEYQKDFLSKNNRQPTWFEVAKFMEDQAITKLEAKQEATIKTQEEEAVKQKEAANKQNDETNKYVESTLNELYENEKLPKIANKEDKDDYGLRVQQALLKTVIDINQERINKGVPPKTIKEIYYEDFKIPGKQVPGADAPTNMGRGGFTPDDTQTIDYKRDIAGSRNSIRNIINNAFKKTT